MERERRYMQDFYETISNWSNNLGNTYNMRNIKASARCHQLKERGYTKTAAEEILISEGYGPRSVEEIATEVFGGTAIKTASSIEVFVVPTSYKDVQKLVEHRLNNVGPEKFAAYLTECERPIIEATTRYKKNLIKIAQACIESPSNFSHLHAELRPYLEETMLNSVLLSEQNKAEINKVNTDEYLVQFPAKEARVNLASGLSSGDRFRKGNFDKFGIADEFLIKAHDSVSPYNRIKKVIIKQ